MAENYLLDTNAYFNLLKLAYQFKDDDSSCPESVKKLKSNNLYVSTVTKVEIISVLGKYARGVNGGYNKCNCFISSDGKICENQKYTYPRKKWSNKKIKLWLQLIDETITGRSTLAQLGLLPFSEKTIEEARRIILHALTFSFGSMDAIIAATAKESISNQKDMIVVTSDKSLKACLAKCGLPFWDAFES